MASNITVKTSPPEYNPVYNPIRLCVFENDAPSRAEPNYKYIIEVTPELLDTITFYVPISPTDNLGYGVQDVSRVLERFIIETLPPTNLTSGFVAAQTRSIKKFDIEIYSGWDVAGVFTKNPSLEPAVVISDRYAWSGSFPHHSLIDQLNETTPFNTWLCNSTNGTAAKFLSYNPEFKARLTDLGYTYAMTDDPGNIDHLNIKTFQADGTLIGTFVVDNPLGATPVSNRVLCVSTAPQSINNIDSAYISVGAQPIITAAAAYYTLQLDKSGAGGISSEELTVTLESNCRYDTYRLHFLNELGGPDYFNFTSRTEVTSSASRKTYTKSEVQIATSGITYSNKDNGKTDYFLQSTNKYKLRSDYISGAQMTWLKELIESTLVFMEYTNTVGALDYKPVTISTSGWKQKIDSIDKLFRLDLDIEEAHTNQRQRR
jgi:hypothetical protein